MKITFALFLLLVSSLRLDAQETEGNQHQIDAVKTIETKENIENWLAGYWSFIEMKSPNGQRIDTIYHGLNDELIEKVERRDYVFNKDKTYATNKTISSSETVNPDSTIGTWYYDSEVKELKLVYHEPITPKYPGLDEASLKQMKELGLLKPQTGFFLEIHAIDEQNLVLIEHQAHDNNEFIYNLLYYKKKARIQLINAIG